MKEVKPVYTPDDEPYLGRRLVYEFDNVISATLEHNQRIAARTAKYNCPRCKKLHVLLFLKG